MYILSNILALAIFAYTECNAFRPGGQTGQNNDVVKLSEIFTILFQVRKYDCQYSGIHYLFLNSAAFNVRRDSVTLSGFSSGGTFAQQLLVSYPSKFIGIAVFSHSKYLYFVERCCDVAVL